MFYSVVFAEKHKERSQCCPRSGRGRGGREGLTGRQSSEHGYWAAGWAGDSTGGYHETLRHHHHHHETTAGPASTHQILSIITKTKVTTSFFSPHTIKYQSIVSLCSQVSGTSLIWPPHTFSLSPPHSLFLSLIWKKLEN